MSSTLVVAEQNVVEFFALFCARQPVFDDTANTALQDRAHSLLLRARPGFAGSHLFAEEIGEFSDLEWFHDDFVRFQKDRGHSALHVGIAADQQRECIRLGVAHRGNDSKTIARVRHVQVRDEHVEALGRDMSQSFCHAGGRDYVKSLAFKGRGHHVANGIVVIHEQDLVRQWPIRSESYSTASRHES